MSSRVTAAGMGPPRGLWVQGRALTRHQPRRTQAGEGVVWGGARPGDEEASGQSPAVLGAEEQEAAATRGAIPPFSGGSPGRLCVETRPALPQSLCAQITSFFKVPRVIGALKGILRGRAAGGGGGATSDGAVRASLCGQGSREPAQDWEAVGPGRGQAQHPRGPGAGWEHPKGLDVPPEPRGEARPCWGHSKDLRPYVRRGQPGEASCFLLFYLHLLFVPFHPLLLTLY